MLLTWPEMVVNYTCCGAELLLFESETDTPAVCDVDGWLCVIERAESRAEKKLVSRNEVNVCLLLLAPDEPAKL